MSYQWDNYTREALTFPEHKTLAAALLTIYREGKEYFPPERKWGGLCLNNYSIGVVPGDRSSMVINITDQYGSFPLFSVNAKRQDVTWKHGKNVIKVTPVPENFRTFLRELRDKVHDIHAKGTEALELKRQTEEEAKKYEGVGAEWDVKRTMIMEGENERKEKMAQTHSQRELNLRLLCRMVDLEDAVGVMHWKASAAELPAGSVQDEKSNEFGSTMLASAKRGPKHDLCEVCGETLRFCAHNGCIIIGCIKCFKDELTMCANCSSVVYCAEHVDDLNECSRCKSLARVACDATTGSAGADTLTFFSRMKIIGPLL